MFGSEGFRAASTGLRDRRVSSAGGLRRTAICLANFLESQDSTGRGKASLLADAATGRTVGSKVRRFGGRRSRGRGRRCSVCLCGA